MKVMLIGGAGFIGSYLARKLIQENEDVLIYDKFVQYSDPLKENYNWAINKRFEGINDCIEIVRGDTSDKNFLKDTVNQFRPDVVVQLANFPIATMTSKYTEEATTSIINGTVNILDIAKDSSFIKKVIYVSSSMVYGDFKKIPAPEEHPRNPKDIYGGMKSAGEEIVKAYHRKFGINYIIIRPSAVYGYTDINRRVTGIFIKNALEGEPLRLNRGGIDKLDFTYVEDLASGILLAIKKPIVNETFNMTRGEGRSIREFAEVIKRYVPETKIETKDDDADPDRPLRGAMDISKAKELLGYFPKYSIEEGIEETLKLINGDLKLR